MDLSELSGTVVPYAAAAAAAYGGAVVQRATDDGADATVSWGRRLMARLATSRRGPQVSEAVQELADDPADEGSRMLVRAQVLKAVTEDPELAADLRAMLTEAAPAVHITNSSGFQVGSNNTQTNHFGARPGE